MARLNVARTDEEKHDPLSLVLVAVLVVAAIVWFLWHRPSGPELDTRPSRVEHARDA
jgi:hypothetical protein